MRAHVLRLPQSAATIGPIHHPLSKMVLSFEDFPVGRFGTFGPCHVTREEILEFAAEYDPQPMHLDEEAAKKTILNGLSSSGWHLCAVMVRQINPSNITLIITAPPRWARRGSTRCAGWRL